EILFAILLALFLSALDQTIVGTALPRVVTDLRGNELYTWVVTIYLLTATITGPIYGKLSDQFGRRPLLAVGISLFLLGSFLSGLSQDMVQLIIFRGIQGLGAGSIFPIALAVIGDLFTPQERGKYQGLFGAVFGIAALIGPALGGFLTDTISWHWVFFVNLPVGAVALAIIWRLLPAHQGTGVTRRIDYLGVFVFTLALVPILVGLTNKQTLEWTDPWVGGLMLLGALLGVVFLVVEARAAEPILPLELFRNRTYAASMTAAFLASFGFFGAIIFLPRWYQVVAGSSATESGYQLLPLLGGLILGSTLSGQLVSRTGRYKLLTVGALLTLAVGLLLMTNLRADTPPPVLWLWQFVAGIGIGPSLIVFTIVVQNAVPWQKLGVATSNLTFFRQIGGTVGLAMAGTIFGATLQREAPRQVASALDAAGVPRPQIDAFAAQFAAGGSQINELSGVGDLSARILARVPDALQPLVEPLIPAIVHGIHEAFSLGIANTMWLSVGATLVAAVAAMTLREVPLGARLERQPTPTPSLEPVVAD
ncbi:MAG TPA: MDR family MFS transporter, partial [Candidatus Caenarcaniphilales bacterium]|nr:MDR family MFS transporter [Candidatus Caenarcaniphilales bacterium]